MRPGAAGSLGSEHARPAADITGASLSLFDAHAGVLCPYLRARLLLDAILLLGCNLLLEEKFAGAVGGFYYGFDQGDAEFAFFEFQDAIDGAACGSGDGVF